MEQIALTRRVTGTPGAVRDAVLLATLEPLRRSAYWRGVGMFLASNALWLTVLMFWYDAVDLVVIGAVIGALGGGFVTLGAVARARSAHRMVCRDLAVGATLAAGCASGVVRLSGPDEDLVMRTDCLHAVEERGELVVFLGNSAGDGASGYPRALFSDDDLARLRTSSPASLPARDDETVALSHETFLDDRWRGRVARAYLAHAAGSPAWWAVRLVEAVAFTAFLTLALDPSSTPELALRAAGFFVVFSLWGLVRAYRVGLRSGTPPPQGLRLATGVGADGFRLQGPTADVVHRREGIEQVCVRGDVVHVHLVAGSRLMLPRELVDVRALTLPVDGGSSVRG